MIQRKNIKAGRIVRGYIKLSTYNITDETDTIVNANKD